MVSASVMSSGAVMSGRMTPLLCQLHLYDKLNYREIDTYSSVCSTALIIMTFLISGHEAEVRKIIVLRFEMH